MIKTIRSIHRYNVAILWGAMAINYLHQSLFFYSQGAWLFAFLMPLVIDLMILLCVKITQTPNAARHSKRNAFIVLIPFIMLSGSISAYAPGNPFMRFVFAAVVAEIGLAEWLKSSFKIDEPAVKVRAPRSADSIAKAAATRAANKATKDATAQKRRDTIERKRFEKEIAAMSTMDNNAPVSPPVGNSHPGIYM